MPRHSFLFLSALVATAAAHQWPPHHEPPHYGPPYYEYPDQAGGRLAYSTQTGSDYDYTGFEQNQTIRAGAVIEMYRYAWDGYRKFAFGHDDLLPLNNSFSDSRNGWGLTLVDGMDTAIIMEQTDIVNEMLDFIPTVDFTQNHSPGPVITSLFETNIRYLGGLMGAYDLLKGPFAHLVAEDCEWKVDKLLVQAVALADTLKFAFNTPSGIPVNDFYLGNRSFSDQTIMDGSYTAGVAQFATLCLEWQHLSDLTGNPGYGQLAQKAEANWFRATQIWPGLTGSSFNISTGEVFDKYGGWTSGNDSAYEYLLKMYVYDPERYSNYSVKWREAADSTLAHLLSSPSTRPDLTYVTSFIGTETQNETDYLSCFMAGSFILGSSVFNESKYLDAGLKFGEFCANGYRYTASGIGPTFYSWNTSILNTANFTNQTDLYQRAGWFIPDNTAYASGQYPEACEGWYYAYRATGDQYWRDVIWAYTLAQNTTERVGSGWATLNDVLVPNGNGTNNMMQSWMLAETLKYQYMAQLDGDEPWQVLSGKGKKNQFVLNTEAHPFKVATKNPV